MLGYLHWGQGLREGSSILPKHPMENCNPYIFSQIKKTEQNSMVWLGLPTLKIKHLP